MTFKYFDPINDFTSERSEIYEVVPLSGSLFSGSSPPLANWKQYKNQIKSGSISGSFFCTVYDSTISVSASALVDVTWGMSVSSSYYAMSNVFIKDEKSRVYKQFAEQLLGDRDGIFTWNGVKQNELFFLTLKRGIGKDKVRRGFTTLSFHFNEGDASDVNVLTDAGASSYYFKGPGGDYMYLTSSNAESSCTPGCVWYDAHTIAVSPTGAINIAAATPFSGSTPTWNYDETIVSGTIDTLAISFGCWFNPAPSYPDVVKFHNTTNIFSRIYFCSATHREFNYSSNPSAIDTEGRIRVTSGSLGTKTKTYITTIGLYDVNNTLLAVAKLSNPVKKDPSSACTIRCRLLY